MAIKEELVHYSVAMVSETLVNIQGVFVLPEPTVGAKNSALLDWMIII